jgi:hypothetical protein
VSEEIPDFAKGALVVLSYFSGVDLQVLKDEYQKRMHDPCLLDYLPNGQRRMCFVLSNLTRQYPPKKPSWSRMKLEDFLFIDSDPDQTKEYLNSTPEVLDEETEKEGRALEVARASECRKILRIANCKQCQGFHWNSCGIRNAIADRRQEELEELIADDNSTDTTTSEGNNQ